MPFAMYFLSPRSSSLFKLTTTMTKTSRRRQIRLARLRENVQNNVVSRRMTSANDRNNFCDGWHDYDGKLWIYCSIHLLPTMLLSSILSKRSLARTSTSVRSLSTSEKVWKVYLSGEIHSDWREVIANGISEKKLPVSITSPNTSHEDSDDCGATILGMEQERPNWDKIGKSLAHHAL